jgi:hypothetical protein
MARVVGSMLLLAGLATSGCIVGLGALDRDDDGVPAPEDCDDDNATVSPISPEICGNGVDDDCDGVADGADSGIGAATFFGDRDGDGYGDPARVATACSTPPDGYVGNDRDCDDTQRGVNPGRVDDTCDGVDDNCDGDIDEDAVLGDWFQDADGDGFGAGAPEHTCAPQAGWVRSAGDCDDSDDQRYPGARETCNGIDDNCVGGVDEGLLGSGEACAAPSCVELFDELGAAADGDFWLTGDSGPYMATCDIDDDYGGGWMFVDLAFIEELDLASFEVGGAPGALARWNGTRTGLEMNAGGGDVCATDPRWALTRITLPERFTEIRGEWTLTPIKGTGLPHIGLDNDASAGFRAAPKCSGPTYRGALHFGNTHALWRPAGLTDDWSGAGDTPYTFAITGEPESTADTDQVWWQLSGIHRDAYTGGRLTEIRLYVR